MTAIPMLMGFAYAVTLALVGIVLAWLVVLTVRRINRNRDA